MHVGIFPGSFDPFTNGHKDIVQRGLMLLDKIIVAMGVNTDKRRYFDPDSTQAAIANTFAQDKRIQVVQYNELTARLAEKYGAQFLLRGLRNTTDFEFENSVAQINRHLYAHLETVFLITSPQYAPINSSLIREVHQYGGEVSTFLPYDVRQLKVIGAT